MGINEISDAEFLEGIKNFSSTISSLEGLIVNIPLTLGEENKKRLQKIIDRLTVPEDIEAAAVKLYLTMYPNGRWERDTIQHHFRNLATYVWPHLATGLKPGDEVRVRDSENGVWNTRFYVGEIKRGPSPDAFICEDKNGNYCRCLYC